MYLIIFLMSLATAAPPDKAKTCVACHGENGISPNDLWPNIAGQKEQYMVKQIKEFREGTRKDPLMSPISKDLTDKDIKELAAYYAKMKGAK